MDYAHVCFVICLDLFDFEYPILCRCHLRAVGSLDLSLRSHASGDRTLASARGGHVSNYRNVRTHTLLATFRSLCRRITNVLSSGLDGVKWFWAFILDQHEQKQHLLKNCASVVPSVFSNPVVRNSNFFLIRISNRRVTHFFHCVFFEGIIAT